MNDPRDDGDGFKRQSPWELQVGPPPEHWDDWVELDAGRWPERVERHYECIPTICFNCEAACGLLGFVDKETREIVKFEGNPVHPGSRGRTCAKGPATLNQIRDPERILAPLKRQGPRGSGKWVEVSWDDAVRDIGGRIARAFDEGRKDEVIYHVGRPGDDHFMPRLLAAWGIDGHNSHTNVCSSAARLGYALWCGSDRPSPDYTGTKFMLLLSAHLETGHYFNPHAQRIMDAKTAGARLGVIDTRLSNTVTHADLWIASWPGTEAALLFGVARELLTSGRYDAEFVRRWTNWEAFLGADGGPRTFERFVAKLLEVYERFTPEFVAHECRVPADTVTKLADEIARAGNQFSSHLWRNAASGNLHGWEVARALVLLHVLTGSLGRPGGLNPASWDKVTPKPSLNPPPPRHWNETIWPREYPLSHYEMSFLLPHILREKKRRVDVYFTRVYNPVWTNPDGCSWVEMFEHPDRIGCHVAITPTWSETAQWADYILPTGLGPERHDLMSQETHAGTWIGFRQPILREYRRRHGEQLDSTLGANPGKVWEETELWIALTWAIDPDGSRGIRRYYESKKRPGTPIALDEYYADIFDQGVPGLPEAAKKEGLDPLGYMRRFGAYAVPYKGQERFEAEKKPNEPGVDVAGGRKAGFPTPSGRLEFFSQTMIDWGAPDHAIPTYETSHVHWSKLDHAAGERLLLATFRLPTLIHTRSGNAKWLQEISHTNPLWTHPEDAESLGIENGALVRVTTRIGYFVVRGWITEGIHPGVVGCSHHLGRWRLHREIGGAKLSSALVDVKRNDGTFFFRQTGPVGPYESDDPDTSRIWWNEAGVNQNLTFPVQPDPLSGMHCWHQKVTVQPARPDDRYGDVFVDTKKAAQIYAEWLALTHPAPGPGGLRRPMWLGRPFRPADEMFKL